MAAGIPEGLGVEVGGVHAVGRRVDAGELPLVEVDEGCCFLLHHLVSFGLAERRHLPGAVGCRAQHKDMGASSISHADLKGATEPGRDTSGSSPCASMS